MIAGFCFTTLCYNCLPSSLMFQAVILLYLFVLLSCTPQPDTTHATRPVSDGCDGCELMYADIPADIDWQDTLPGWEASDQKLVLKGKVLKPGGRTPAEGVILYFYQTDSTGHYTRYPGQPSTMLHGHIRGWVKTNETGDYKIYTTRPAPYPGASVPAHVHVVVKEADAKEYYIDDFEFIDDTLLTEAEKAKREKRGGSGICQLAQVGHGWQGATRNITLGLNIPNYPQ
jgi:protocatechuate 3,4-dioxygenase beta subunit